MFSYLKNRVNSYVVRAISYVIVLLVVFMPVVFSGKSLFPYTQGRPNNQIIGNESIQRYMQSGGTYWDAGASDWIEIPIIEKMGDSLHEGDSLLWSSYNGLGFPVIPNSSAATVAPFDMIPMIFQSEWSWNFMYLIRLWFMMFFSYAFLRELGISEKCAFMVGILFSLCGYSMYHMNMFHFNVDVFLPLLMFVTVRFYKNRSIYRWGWLTFVVAMMMLGGNPQNLITGIALAHLFFLIRVCVDKGSLKGKICEYIKYCSSYFVAALVTMYFWLPFLELFKNGYNYHAEDTGLFSVNVMNLLGLLFPSIYFDNAEFYTYLCYVGIGVLPIILLYTTIKDKTKWIFIGFVIAYTLKLLGFPLVQWIGYLPIFNMINYLKYSCSLYFAIFVLFAYAYDEFRKEEIEEKRYKVKRGIIKTYYCIWIIIVSVVIAIICKQSENNIKLEKWVPWLGIMIVIWLGVIISGAVENIFKKKIFSVGIMLCVVVEIVVVPCYLNYFRIDSGVALEHEVVDAHAIKQIQKNEYDRISTLGISFMGNMSAYYDIYNIACYTAVPVSYYYEFMKELVLEEQLDINYMDPVSSKYIEQSNKYLDLLGVSHVVADAYEVIETDTLSKVYENASFSIYENEGYFDKAFYVYDYKQLDEKEEIFDFLRKQKDLSKAITVEAGEILTYETDRLEGIQDEVSISEYKDGRVEIKCNSNEDGFLVLNDLYYPGWRAYVDGEEVDIYKTDYVLRSVFLTAGEHTVTYVYQPMAFYVGLAISIITVLGYIVVVVSIKNKR